MSVQASGTHTTYHALGVTLEITGVLDGSKAVVEAHEAGSPGLYRVLLDEVLLGFLQWEDGWTANAIGTDGGHPIDGERTDLDAAARAAAEHFTGRTLR